MQENGDFNHPYSREEREDMSEEKLAGELKNLITRAEKIVFLTGAGISTESGIPDFRSPGGLYSDPENANVFEIGAFLAAPDRFYRFAKEFLALLDRARPNPAHLALARLEAGHQVTVVTQNIDGLHQRAGSTKVWCVHGDFGKSKCVSCGHAVATESLRPAIEKGRVPYHACGGFFRPLVTFFGEALPALDWERSAEAVAEADLLCVVGSSLVVHPAAALPRYRREGARLAIVNRGPTPLDGEAELVINGSAGRIFSSIV